MDYIIDFPDEFLIVVDCLSKPAVKNRHVPLNENNIKMSVVDQLCTLVTGLLLIFVVSLYLFFKSFVEFICKSVFCMFLMYLWYSLL